MLCLHMHNDVQSPICLLENLYFGVFLFIDSKWKLLVFQSIRRLCKMSHDNPMMIRFVRNEMTLKTTLLLYDLIITINTLGSCVTTHEERLWTSIILTATSITFSTNTKLCYHTNFLLMKHVDAPESKNAWVCIVMDLPPLIVMGNEKQVVGPKDKVG